MTARAGGGPAGPGERILVDSRKYGGGPHKRWTAYRLGEDAHGVWIGVPGSTRVETPGGGFTHKEPAVRVVPREAWWSASFSLAPSRVSVYVDVCLPSRWEGAVLHMVDLDLDVVVPRAAGSVPYLDDEDEFDEHRVRYGYPPDVVAGARRAADDVLAGLASGAEPFASVYRAWLSGFSNGDGTFEE